MKQYLAKIKDTILSTFSKTPKIEIFVRHCHFSQISQHKVRYPNFTKKIAYDNLLSSIGENRVNVTYFLDAFYPSEGEHFVKLQDKHPVIEVKEGTETGSFLKLLDHVASLKCDPETIIYFLEDDYLHRDGWVDVLLEGFSIPGVDYVTLYDHKDKYFAPSYNDLQAKLFLTESCHWRTTPSTTNTFAMKYSTLMKHLDVHKEFSLNRKISADHEKFCKLNEMGATLISPIPGWSTHVERDFISPCVDWGYIIQKHAQQV